MKHCEAGSRLRQTSRDFMAILDEHRRKVEYWEEEVEAKLRELEKHQLVCVDCQLRAALSAPP